MQVGPKRTDAVVGANGRDVAGKDRAAFALCNLVEGHLAAGVCSRKRNQYCPRSHVFPLSRVSLIMRYDYGPEICYINFIGKAKERLSTKRLSKHQLGIDETADVAVAKNAGIAAFLN